MLLGHGTQFKTRVPEKILWTAATVVQALPTPRGMPRPALTKYGLGGVILFILLFIIWFPLLLFSMSSSIYTPAAPVSVKVSIKIGGYEVRDLLLLGVSRRHGSLLTVCPFAAAVDFTFGGPSRLMERKGVRLAWHFVTGREGVWSVCMYAW